jgi:hypothetical protein
LTRPTAIVQQCRNGERKENKGRKKDINHEEIKQTEGKLIN